MNIKSIICKEFNLKRSEVSYRKNSKHIYLHTERVSKEAMQLFIRQQNFDLGSYYSDDYCDNEIRYYSLNVHYELPQANVDILLEKCLPVYNKYCNCTTATLFTKFHEEATFMPWLKPTDYASIFGSFFEELGMKYYPLYSI